MSREIKFRAWCEVGENEYEMIEEWCYLNREENHFYAVDITNDRTDIGDVVAVMQYTGLKDKNGKEIYEGDIVRFKDGSGMYVIKYNNKEASFMRMEIKKPNNWMSSVTSEEWLEVIGNIYENPDLLNA